MNGSEISYSALGKLLPHGFPFLMVDRVLEYSQLKTIRGIKNVSGSEPYMKDATEGKKRFPSGLIIESIGQLAGVLYRLSYDVKENSKFILGKTSDVKIESFVYAGDQLTIDVQFDKVTDDFFIASGSVANYEGQPVLTVGEIIILIR